MSKLSLYSLAGLLLSALLVERGQEDSQQSQKDPNQVTLFMCGDIMIGRGIDQILPHPSDPHIHEPWVRSARRYVGIAEEVNGPIQQPVSFSYIF